MSIWAIVPAAGVGSRIGGTTPKQYLKLAGLPIIQRTIHKLSQVGKINSCIVALNADDRDFVNLELPESMQIKTITGGNERVDSVFNCLEYLHTTGAKADDWVLVHDAGRPLVKLQDIENLLTKILDSDIGGILAVPASDTVKIHEDNTIKTIDRKKIWLALTPQVFRFGLLYDALKNAKRKSLTITDEAQAIELMGLSPILVAGSKTNIKITYPEDLTYAKWLLGNEG